MERTERKRGMVCEQVSAGEEEEWRAETKLSKMVMNFPNLIMTSSTHRFTRDKAKEDGAKEVISEPNC